MENLSLDFPDSSLILGSDILHIGQCDSAYYCDNQADNKIDDSLFIELLEITFAFLLDFFCSPI